MTVPRQHGRPVDDGGPAPTEQLMRAVVQDTYGSVDVLHSSVVPVPDVGPDDVLTHVRAASVHIGDWHLMTGTPYLMRVAGSGLRGPNARVRGTDVS